MLRQSTNGASQSHGWEIPHCELVRETAESLHMKTLIIHNAGMNAGNWTTALWINDQRIEGYSGVIDLPEEFVGEDGLLKSGYGLERQLTHGPIELTSYEDEVVSDGRGGSVVFDGAKTVHLVLEPRQITAEEQRAMTLPELPNAHWLRESYRLGMNPLPTCRRAFPGWQWEYHRGAGEGMGFSLTPNGREAIFPAFEQGVGGGHVIAKR